MKRKLVLLNLLLLAASGAGGLRLRRMWQQEEAREQAIMRQKLPPAPPVPVGLSAPPSAVQAGKYFPIADQMLFSKDRNPQVVVEAPPEKPVPPLPAAYGIMNFGDGPLVMMAEKAGERNRGIRVGDKIGEFTLAKVDGRMLTLTWEDKVIEKRLEDLVQKRPANESKAGAAAPQEKQRVPKAPPPPPPPKKADAAPGVKLTDTLSACQPGDDSPPGTVKDGMRKVVSKTPFGNACRWEAVQ